MALRDLLQKTLMALLLLGVLAFMKSPLASEFGTNSPVKMALIIGNQDYRDAQLRLDNSVNDAKSMARKLSQLGFQSYVSLNKSKADLLEDIGRYIGKVRVYQRQQIPVVSLLFYAGHGMQLNQQNYLMPTDVSLLELSRVREQDIRAQLVSLGQINQRLATLQNQLDIVILDACRDLPFGELQQSSLGWSDVAKPGFFVAFGTAPGTQAADGVKGNGVFTQAILQHIDTPGLTLSQLFQQVRSDVSEQTLGLQVPQESNSSTRDFYFKQAKAADTFWPIPFVIALGFALFLALVVILQRRNYLQAKRAEQTSSAGASDPVTNHSTRYGYLRCNKTGELVAEVTDIGQSLGRGRQADVQIDDPDCIVSREHVWFGFDKKHQQFWLQERQGSANGTFIDSLAEAIRPTKIYRLKAGQSFYLAKNSRDENQQVRHSLGFRFELASEAVQ